MSFSYVLHPNALVDPPGTMRSHIEIMLMELHDSEFDANSPPMTGRTPEGVGRLLASAPLDVAIAAVAKGLSVWAPTQEDLDTAFNVQVCVAIPLMSSSYALPSH